MTIVKNKLDKSSLKISSDLSLYSVKLNKEESKPALKTIHTVFVIDCSGSMYSELTKIKNELKNKLPSLMKIGDTASIIYFSGKGQYGTLVNNVEVKSLLDFTSLNNSIDKLHDIGLTGFKEPLEEVKKLISQDKNKSHSLFFLTDGYDNCWNESEILNSITELKPLIASATFVEYGYYANKKLLSQMAANIGGTSIFAEDFYSFIPLMESALNTEVKSDKVEFEISGSLYDFCYSLIDGNIVQYKIENNVALVNPDYPINYFVASSINESNGSSLTNELYASLVLFSQQGKSDVVYKILNYTKDIYLIKNFINAYGKRDLTRFESIALAIAKGTVNPGIEGFDSEFIPKEDAFCVMNLLEILSQDKDNKFYPSHESFKYSKISSRTVQSSTILPKEPVIFSEGMTIEEFNKENNTNVLNAEDAHTVYFDKLNEFRNFKPYELKYELKEPNKGYSMHDMVFNKNRANVSIRIHRIINVYGFPEDNKFNLPITKEDLKDNTYSQVESMSFNTYTIIADGLVNVKVLPVTLSLSSFNRLRDVKVIDSMETFSPDKIYLLDLTKLPVINRKMVQNVSAIDLCTLEYEHLMNQAKLKVIKHFYPQDKGMPEFVDEKILYLKELGISRNGFSPKVTVEHSGETYASTELLVKIKSLSSLGKVEDAIRLYEEIEKGNKPKITLKDEVLFPALEYMKKSFTYSEEALTKLISSIEYEQSLLSLKISSIKTSIILGQSWFTEFKTRSENTLILKFNNKDYMFTLDLVDKEIAL